MKYLERITDLILIASLLTALCCILFLLIYTFHVTISKSYILGEISQIWHITWRLVRLHYLREIKVFTFARFTQISIESPGEIQSVLII